MITKSKMQAIINAIVSIRDNVTDDQALTVIALYPEWKPGVEYKVGQRILYNDILYKVLQGHESQDNWLPHASPSLFAKVLIPDENVIPEWEQPDSTNTYASEDKVIHNGKIWVSIIDNNSWEPGVFGWEEVN